MDVGRKKGHIIRIPLPHTNYIHAHIVDSLNGPGYKLHLTTWHGSIIIIIMHTQCGINYNHITYGQCFVRVQCKPSAHVQFLAHGAWLGWLLEP